MGVGTWPKMAAGGKDQREPPKWDFLSKKNKRKLQNWTFFLRFQLFWLQILPPPLLSKPLCTKSQPCEPTCPISQNFFFTWWTYMFKFSTKFLNYHGKSQILEQIHLLKSNLLHLTQETRTNVFTEARVKKGWIHVIWSHSLINEVRMITYNLNSDWTPWRKV